MTHRDDLLAMRAHLDALEQELDDVRAENELLRDAHTRRALEGEALRREVAAARDAARDAALHDAPLDDAASRDAESAHDARAEEAAIVIPASARRRSDRALSTALAGAMAISAVAMFAGLGALRLSRPAMHTPAPMAHVAPLERAGTIAAVEGFAELSVGDACAVRREAVHVGRFDCRVVVECGGHVLYGAEEYSGFVRCGGRERFQDPDTTSRDGDPAMLMDLAANVVVVEDDVGEQRWSVRVQM